MSNEDDIKIEDDSEKEVSTDSVEKKLATAKTRNRTLLARLDAVTKNYDTLFRQFGILENKYRTLQEDYVVAQESLNTISEDRDKLYETVKRSDFKDRYPRNIRTQQIRN